MIIYTLKGKKENVKSQIEGRGGRRCKGLRYWFIFGVVLRFCRVQAGCGKFKFHVTVVREKIVVSW